MECKLKYLLKAWDCMRSLRGYTHWKEQKELSWGCSECRLRGRTTNALRSYGTVTKKKRKLRRAEGRPDLNTMAGQCGEDWRLAVGPLGLLKFMGLIVAISLLVASKLPSCQVVGMVTFWKKLLYTVT